MDEVKPQDFQALLEYLGDYLRGDWWHIDEETRHIEFHDGDDEPDQRACGPELKWFDEYSFQSLYAHLASEWKKCIDDQIDMPISYVSVFGDNGDVIGKMYYEPWYRKHYESIDRISLRRRAGYIHYIHFAFSSTQ